MAQILAKEIQAVRGQILLAEGGEACQTLGPLLIPHVDVTVVATVSTALQVLRRSPIDVLVADYQLPDGTGLDILQKSGSLAPYLVVLLLTEPFDLVKVVAARKDRRVFKIILKPYDLGRVLGWVNSAVMLSHTRRSGTRRKSDP